MSANEHETCMVLQISVSNKFTLALLLSNKILKLGVTADNFFFTRLAYIN